MAKRFTSTEKWDKIWFRKLTPEHKCFWIYLLDRCDHAGIWEVDFELAEWYLGSKLNIEDIKLVFKKQYAEIDDGSRWFILDFVLFQQKVNTLDDLNVLNKCHLSIINRLKSKGLISPLQAPSEGLDRGYSNSKGIGKGISNSKGNSKDIKELTGGIISTWQDPRGRR